ncbi:hypothetical protein Ppa06_43940 [Planomonospora parontospora subsp. parontospora]|uniref:Uncharacterized protein n=2 Tax=Planomonospora parontospora TaxID=58119 RepID=A0AA37BKW7_9ACTN|nr:hypothetical protein GCM10010126_49790 [Planomonospora parontospora]GII10596.1 hypothetical protein Ppa06_43940 [Planomonospora parontospora subsp. parontospora]
MVRTPSRSVSAAVTLNPSPQDAHPPGFPAFRETVGRGGAVRAGSPGGRDGRTGAAAARRTIVVCT